MRKILPLVVAAVVVAGFAAAADAKDVKQRAKVWANGSTMGQGSQAGLNGSAASGGQSNLTDNSVGTATNASSSALMTLISGDFSSSVGDAGGKSSAAASGQNTNNLGSWSAQNDSSSKSTVSGSTSGSGQVSGLASNQTTAQANATSSGTSASVGTQGSASVSASAQNGGSASGSASTRGGGSASSSVR